MDRSSSSFAQPAPRPTDSTPAAEETVVNVLFALSFAHLLNDTVQSLIPAIYPVLKVSFHLNFTQIGWITFAFQVTASLLQPLVGSFTDRRPLPYSLAFGMGITLVGLVLLSQAHSFGLIVFSSALVGTGSSIFHPEASRLARLASGGKHGFAQSLFQVGGNFGSSLGPLLAAAIVAPYGQRNVIWFSILALIAIFVLAKVGGWYRQRLLTLVKSKATRSAEVRSPLSKGKTIFTLAILLALIFSKYFYLASLTNYYTFYLIHRFGVSVQQAQIYLFLFLFAVAAGTFAGGPLGDRFSRKYVIWISILGVAPFSLVLPYVGLVWTALLSVIIGVILASAFSAILVYAQELIPGKVGMIAGLFFGFAFGVAGIGSALLGKLADHSGIDYVYHVCSFLPLIGLIAAFLPKLEEVRKRAA